MKQPNGFYYRFRSRIDGAPCVLVFTGFARKSANEKTDDMIQTWILREDMDPLEAIKTFNDYSVCGNCPKRHNLRGNCYVVVCNAPLAVWRAYKRGAYRHWFYMQANQFLGRKLRIGSYGDPYVLPRFFWGSLVNTFSLAFHTGYTHQWAQRDSDDLLDITQASVSSEAEWIQAEGLGWKCFRDSYSDKLLPGELRCPAQDHKTTCSKCGACDGVTGHRMIRCHGVRAKV